MNVDVVMNQLQQSHILSLTINNNTFGNKVYVFYIQILQKLIAKDKEENQGDAHQFMSGPSINVMIRRNYIYEDAFEKLSQNNGRQE